jgi:peptidoglycan/xylan/chitin deacetylase (PgdA/CDA1 family)
MSGSEEPSARAARIPILCYHAVSEDTGGPLAPWALDPGRFAEHLDALADAGHRPVALDDLVTRVHDRGEPPPAGALVLTVDDGYADAADTLWPLLAERSWPATLYVSTGFVGGTFLGRPVLDEHQVRDLAQAGMAIGAHGHRHLALDAVDPVLARDEIERSRDLLAEWTGAPVTSFAYPHGFHDRTVRSFVVEAGFHSACAVKQALSSSADDRFALARIMPTGDLTAEQLVGRLRSPRTPVAEGGREALRTTAFRAVRRARRRRVAA